MAPYVKRNHLFLLPLEINAESRRLVHASATGQTVPPAVSAASHSSAPYIALDIMFNWHSDCPGKQAGADASSFAVSPDGSKVAFACRATLADGTQPSEMAWSTDTSVFLCHVPLLPADDRSGEVLVSAAKVSGECLAAKASPAFSPCGRYIA